MTTTYVMLLLFQVSQRLATSTTCFVLGLDDGMKLINSLEGIEAVFMTNDGSKYYSDNAKAYIN